MTATLGATGWCLFGRHDRCSYRPGGACHGGIALSGGGAYTCPCECHAASDIPEKQFPADVTRLTLFEIT